MAIFSLLGAALAAAASPAPATNPNMVDTPVLSHPVARGEILSAADFEPQPRARGFAIGALPVASAAGREAVRDLSAGNVVRAGDVVTPRLVRRGEPVTISLRGAGLVIGTTGRALGSGGMGDLVRVVAPATGRTLDTIVEGSGAVRVAAP